MLNDHKIFIMKNASYWNKAIFAFCFCNLFLCHAMQASPAYPKIIRYRQPNGEFINVKLIGDENLNYRFTEDDYSLLFDKEGYLVYAELDSIGNMVPSKVRASAIGKRLASEQKFLSSHVRHLTYSRSQLAQVEARRKAMNPSKNKAAASRKKAASVGDKKVLVILVEFADKAFSRSNSDFQALMNETGFNQNGAQGSVNDYYKYASGGKLNLTAHVVGPYTLPHSMSYYGKNTYGNGSDANPRAMAGDALALADPDVDFSKFDSDNDGTLDGVHIIYAGYGEEAGGGSDCIWAHKWNVSGKHDGISISDYSCSPELRGNYGTDMTHIGVICHELGHVLGCMDYYDTDYADGGQYQGNGQWDIMASGNWNSDGATPANFNPYVRCYDFGWETPIELDIQYNVTINAGEQTVYRMNTQADGEYFLMENRQQQDFDKAIPGHGLMIYKVNADAYNVPIGNSSNRINATYPQNMYLVSANSGFALPSLTPSSYGVIDVASCAFSNYTGKTAFTDETKPSCKSSNGLYTEKGIENIRETNGTITFDLCGGSDNPMDFKASNISTKKIELSWKTHADKKKVMIVGSVHPITSVPQSVMYQLGETLSDGKTKVLYIGTDNHFTHTDLQENSTYYYRIHTCLSDNPVTWSSGAGLCVQTSDGNKPQYSYMQKFDTFDWNQELLEGELYWEHGVDVISPDYTTGTASWRVTGGMNNPDGFRIHSSVLTTPPMDLSRSKYATLTFDYNIGKYEKLLIYYRLSSNEKWTLLESYTKQTKGWKKAVIKLPMLSPTLQIGFSANHNIEFGHTLNKTEAFIHLDNIGVATQFKAMPITLEPVSYGNKSATIPVRVLTGDEKVTEYGVEMQTSTQTIRVAKTTSDSIFVEGLQPGVSYTYSTYAMTESGILYGDKSVLRTIAWQDGEGTIDSPFLIDSEDDLHLLSSEVAGGQDFRNCYFKMVKDITMNQPFISIGDYGYERPDPVHPFKGVFDGNGKTIRNLKLQITGDNRTTHKHCGLFGMLDEEGVVKHLNVKFDKITNLSALVDIGIIASQNMGAIIDCHVDGNDLSITTNDGLKKYLGGIVAQNYGYIASCTNKINIEGIGSIGGIAAENYATIINCVNYGNIGGYEYIGGIAGYSSSGVIFPNGDEHDYVPHISRCINYGDVKGKDTSFSISIGGISGEAVGKISECANFGNIIVDGTENYYIIQAGGIAGYLWSDDGAIRSCLNQGDIIVSAGVKEAKNGLVGGICGMHYYISIQNCVNTGKISASQISFCDAITPDEEWATFAKNNYFLENVTDNTSKHGVAFSTDSTAEIVKKLNAESSNNIWETMGQGELSLNVLSDNILHIGTPVFLNSHGYTMPVIYECKEAAELEFVKDIQRPADAIRVPLDKDREYVFLKTDGLESGTFYYVRIKTPSAISDWKETATLFNGVGSEKMPFEITSLQNLKALSILINSGMLGKNYSFRQTASIDLQCDSVNSWIPIGAELPFGGIYDGGGHEITNMYVSDNHLFAGLFGYISGDIRNVALVGNNVVNAPNSKYTGGIFAYKYSFDNEYHTDRCLFHGTVIGGENVGGICGYTNNDIFDCGVVANLYGTGRIGGITADFTANDVKNCYVVAEPISNCKISAIAPENTWGSFYCKNNYFLKDDRLESTYGTAMSKEEMTSDVLISQLFGTNIWTRDVEPYKNEGYPIFKSNTEGTPIVITLPVLFLNSEQATLRGTCLSGDAKPSKTGFEIRVDRQTSNIVYQETENELNSIINISSVVDVNIDDDNQYLYRAFADINGTRYYGEEIMLDYPTYHISATSSNQDYGTVVTNNCGEKVKYGTPVSLTAIPNEGCKFIGWLMGENIVSTENPYTFTAKEDMALIAKFVPENYDAIININEELNENKNVSIYSLDGVLLMKDMPYHKAINKLPGGIYIIKEKNHTYKRRIVF